MSSDDLRDPSGVRLDAYLFVERQRERLAKESAEEPGTPSNDLEGGRLSPSPAGSEATEEEGQRYLEDLSASEMSDKYRWPASVVPTA